MPLFSCKKSPKGSSQWHELKFIPGSKSQPTAIKPDRFYQLIAFGLGVTYIFQVFLTIGGGTKFIPLTGVTLPLISYGGSSVLTTLMMFAIVEGLYVLRQKEIEEQMLLKRRRRPGSPNGAPHRRPTTGRPDRWERPDRPVPVRSSYTEDDDFIEDWNESENEGEEFEGEE